MVIIWSNKYIFGSYQSWTFRMGSSHIPGLVPVVVAGVNTDTTSITPRDTGLLSVSPINSVPVSILAVDGAVRTLFPVDQQSTNISEKFINSGTIRISEGENI
jgi:hypothetical protein